MCVCVSLQVIQAHVLPGTITFNSISAELEANDTYTVTSLQGYEWTFALADGGKLVDAGNSSATGISNGTYPVLVDNHNITADGFFNIEADIRKVAEWCAAACITYLHLLCMHAPWCCLQRRQCQISTPGSCHEVRRVVRFGFICLPC